MLRGICLRKTIGPWNRSMVHVPAQVLWELRSPCVCSLALPADGLFHEGFIRYAWCMNHVEITWNHLIFLVSLEITWDNVKLFEITWWNHLMTTLEIIPAEEIKKTKLRPDWPQFPVSIPRVLVVAGNPPGLGCPYEGEVSPKRVAQVAAESYVQRGRM